MAKSSSTGRGWKHGGGHAGKGLGAEVQHAREPHGGVEGVAAVNVRGALHEAAGHASGGVGKNGTSLVAFKDSGASALLRPQLRSQRLRSRVCRSRGLHGSQGQYRNNCRLILSTTYSIREQYPIIYSIITMYYITTRMSSDRMAFGHMAVTRIDTM